MPPRIKPEPVYEPDPDAPQDPLPPPPVMAKHSELRWIDDMRIEKIKDDPEPEYVEKDRDP